MHDARFTIPCIGTLPAFGPPHSPLAESPQHQLARDSPKAMGCLRHPSLLGPGRPHRRGVKAEASPTYGAALTRFLGRLLRPATGGSENHGERAAPARSPKQKLMLFLFGDIERLWH